MLIDKSKIVRVEKNCVPEELKALPQWVLWRAEPRRGALSKVPYQVNGQRAKSDAPETWAPFDKVWGAYQAGRADGIGFVFETGGGLCGVDLDDCFDEHFHLYPRAEAIVKMLDSYVEVSVSGRGLHVICRARLAKGKRRGPLEIYGGGRYFCVTGHVYGNAHTIRDAQGEIDRLVAALDTKPQRQRRSTIATEGTGRYIPNDELVAKARAAKNGAKFSALWAGDTSGYPSQSEADIALMCLLLFWTHGDADRAEILFSQSGLAGRDKWERADYRQRTIRAALDCLNEGGAGYGG